MLLAKAQNMSNTNPCPLARTLEADLRIAKARRDNAHKKQLTNWREHERQYQIALQYLAVHYEGCKECKQLEMEI